MRGAMEAEARRDVDEPVPGHRREFAEPREAGEVLGRVHDPRVPENCFAIVYSVLYQE